MTKDSFLVKTDATSGRKYVMKTDELTKNHRSDTESFSGFMPETGTPACPVSSFQNYVKKLDPRCDRLWCYPKISFF